MEEIINQDSSKFSTNIKRQAKTIISQCKICGGSARYSYYGAIVCQSCKVFFKRNAENHEMILKCRLDSQCEIHINNRRLCPSCRLIKCFKNGMNTEMIRCSHLKKNSKKKSLKMNTLSLISTRLITLNKNHQSEQAFTLNLLEGDQSIMTNDQWNLLSNIVHCFDEYNNYLYVENFIQNQNTLPLKRRFRYSSVNDFLTSIICKTQFIFDKNQNFLSLSIQDRINLFRSTIEYTGTIIGIYILHQYKLFDYFPFYNSIEIILGSNIIEFIKHLIDRFDSDVTFIKIVFTILSFSTNTYTINTKLNSINLTNVKVTLPIQDMYTEIAWKYLLHNYGYYQTIIRFSNLIRCLFFVYDLVAETHKSEQFIYIINSAIEQIEQKFIQ